MIEENRIDIKVAKDLMERKRAADYIASYDYASNNLNRSTLANKLTVLLRDQCFADRVVTLARKISKSISIEIDNL